MAGVVPLPFGVTGNAERDVLISTLLPRGSWNDSKIKSRYAYRRRRFDWPRAKWILFRCKREALAVGAVLVALEKGEIESPEPTPFTQAELDKYFGLRAGSPDLRSNSRCRATRSLPLGWKPVKTTEDMLAAIQAEAEAIIRNKAESTVSKAWTRGQLAY
ncbi:hypothetical protein B0H14DRAFT_3501931 [Mycena olivaceomarginata]|nr:hypothetical protein B0H14DRAFT_3501931 [Mycena olivaceomarginata]